MSFKETELGKIPEKWDLVRLEDIADVLDPHPSHRAPNEVENGFPFAGIGDINEYGEINIEKARKVSENIILNHIENYFIDKNSIGYGRVGTVGKVVKLKERSKYKYALSPTLAVINGNDKVDNDYLYALLRSKIFFNQVKKFMTGSTRPSIGIKALRDIMVPYPSKNEQILIGKIISTLDEKIEVNNQINKTLENIAQTIFKQWFVDFEFPNGAGEPYKSSGGEMVESELGMIPKGWEIFEFREFFKFVKGKKPKIIEENKFEGSYKYLTIDVLNNNSFLYCTNEKVIEVTSQNVLMVMDGASSGVTFFGQSGIVASTLAKLDLYNKKISNQFLYILMKYYEEDIKSHTTGSAIPHTDKEYVYRLKIALPKDDIITKLFNDIVYETSESIIKRSNESKILKELRDSVLPKLMSGEIRVPIEEN